MALLHPTPTNSQGITTIPEKGLMIGEASEMGLRLERLYDDACDVGIALRSHKTGEVSRWYLLDTITDPREGELLGWMFKPCSETVARFPQLANFQLNVIND